MFAEHSPIEALELKEHDDLQSTYMFLISLASSSGDVEHKRELELAPNSTFAVH